MPKVENVQSLIGESFNRVHPEQRDSVGLFLRFAAQGQKTPIFWCFNRWVEPILLSRRLGLEQPLYAMHSLNGLIPDRGQKVLHRHLLAEVYGNQILDIAPDGPVIIGGNCQAGPIAEATAHYIVAKSGRIPMLITLDHSPFYCYPGPVMLMFGSDSEEYNPFLKSVDPLPAWAMRYGSFAWGIVDGRHGEYFFAPAVHDLVDLIQSASGIFCSAGAFDCRKLELGRHASALGAV